MTPTTAIGLRQGYRGGVPSHKCFQGRKGEGGIPRATCELDAQQDKKMDRRYVLGRVHQIPATVPKLACAKRKDKIGKGHKCRFRTTNTGRGALERFAEIRPNYERLISTQC